MESNKIPDNLDAIRQRVKHICSEYGLYGTAFYHTPFKFSAGEDTRSRLYIVAGPTPEFGEDIPRKNLNPGEIVQQIGRNEKLFYPKAWAIDLSDGFEVNVYEQLVDYCKMAEFLSAMYSTKGLELPDKIRISEVHQLQAYEETSNDFTVPFQVREKCQNDIDWFFKRERSTGFRRKWLDYFRSDKFRDEKGALARIVGYFRRNEPKIPLEQLMEVNADIKKLEMQEFEFKLFSEFMKECYPEVSFAVGNKEIVNHGIDQPGKAPLMSSRRITSEEFAVIRKERFAEEGWDCLADVKPSYWEFRDVYFKEIDEPQIAAAYQAVTLQYAQPNDLSELQSRGELSVKKVSVTDFMNFVSLAKTNGLRFYIDKLGQFDEPSLDTVNVVINRRQRELFSDITSRMMSDKVTGSHLLDCDIRTPLDERITNARHIPVQANNPIKAITEEHDL